MQRGCDAAGDCHGGGIRGTFALSPASAKDVHYDFNQAILQVTISPADSSALLTQPLVGGTPHPYKPFATTADTGYQAILQWVQDGVRQ